MKIKTIPIILNLLLILTPILAQSKWVPNQLIIHTKTQLTALSSQSITKFPAGVIPTNITAIYPNTLSAQTNSTLKNSYLIDYKSSLSPPDLATILSENPDIVYAQPNFIYTTQFTPNDSFYNTDQSYLKNINLPEAWDYTTGNTEITIAVIDTGTQTTHEDLSNSLWTNTSEIPNNGIDDDNNSFIDDTNGWNFITNTKDIADDFGHGTIVAGIISSETNNNKGIAGVCPNCKIMTLKSGNRSGDFTTTHVSQAINYAVSQKANIINLSLGGSVQNSDDTELNNILSSAYNANITVISAAGNNNGNITELNWWPATNTNTIAVSALETVSPPSRASYSNFGSSVWITAPGSNIIGPSFSNSNNTTYSRDTGTSMAAPIVTGVAGLILSTNPNLTPSEIKTIFQQSSTDIGTPGHDIYFGYGIVNALQAIGFADNEAPNGTLNEITTHSSDVSIVVTGNFTDNMEFPNIPTANLYYQELKGTEVINDWQTLPMTASGSVFSATIPAPNANVNKIQYYANVSDIRNTTEIPSSLNAYIITLTDKTGPDITFSTKPNDFFSDQSPIAISISDVTPIATENISLTLDTRTYSISNHPNILSFQSNVLTINLSSLTFENGSYSFEITGTDTLGNATTQTQSLQYSKLGASMTTVTSYNKPVNVPNPFNPNTESTFFTFNVTQPCESTIAIYNLNFNRIHTIHTQLQAGYNEVEWNGRDDSQNILPNGVYIYIVNHTFGDSSETSSNKLMIKHW